ncbi:glutamyl-tRNA reductase [Georgenia halophila]|uniref:Glutamyl-tRNA reductase n=1 Tax=Georgenia halophila TaxID=620889 RepID=A0ABP8LCZ2_9MICO
MVLLMLSANHHDLDLADIDRLATGTHGLGSRVVAEDAAVRGAVVLSTCNRFELYLEAAEEDGGESAATAAAYRAVADAADISVDEVARLMRPVSGEQAVSHIFDVAAGLDSMVVGEREIVGQVRRALADARADGTTTPLLERTLQHAARTSRQVAVETDLARAGRSVVAVALDLAAAQLFGTDDPASPATDGVPQESWGGSRTLLVGTGAYAGASLAALRARGAADVAVWSASGRAETFAASHHVEVAPADLTEAVAHADLVVTCRGTGTPVLDLNTVSAAAATRPEGAGALVVVDLALHRDVERGVGDLPGVLLVDLEAVREHAPATTAAEIVRARAIVTEGVRSLAETTAERRMDGAVVALRTRVADVVAEELGKLPAEETVSTERAAQALRRLAARLVHEPTVLAREAGREGRAEEHLRALEQVLGLDVGEPAQTSQTPQTVHVPANHDENERAR